MQYGGCIPSSLWHSENIINTYEGRKRPDTDSAVSIRVSIACSAGSCPQDLRRGFPHCLPPGPLQMGCCCCCCWGRPWRLSACGGKARGRAHLIFSCFIAPSHAAPNVTLFLSLALQHCLPLPRGPGLPRWSPRQIPARTDPTSLPRSDNIRLSLAKASLWCNIWS